MIHFTMGKSMLPTFGRFNFIKISKKISYKEGDVVSLRIAKRKFPHYQNQYVCHRILQIDEKYVTTKGDNLPIQGYETLVPVGEIEGKVKLLWRML